MSLQSYWFRLSQCSLMTDMNKWPRGKMCLYTDIKWTATGFSNFPDCSVQLQHRHWQIFSVSILLHTPQVRPLYYFLHDSGQMDRNWLISMPFLLPWNGTCLLFTICLKYVSFGIFPPSDFNTYIDHMSEYSEKKWSRSLHTYWRKPIHMNYFKCVL